MVLNEELANQCNFYKYVDKNVVSTNWAFNNQIRLSKDTKKLFPQKSGFLKYFLNFCVHFC